jgi:integrase
MVAGNGVSNTAATHASIDDVPEPVKQLAREFLDSANDERRQPEQTRRLGDFVESVYFPWAESQLKPSTLKEYHGIWRRHLRARVSDYWLRDVRTFDVNQWLQSIARQTPRLTTASLQRVKSLLSGVFTTAKNMGFHDGINPVQDADLPRAARGQETHAYSLQEVWTILHALADDPLAVTVVAVAAFAGLRRSEIRGLRWEECNDYELKVARGVWESHVGATKTRASESAVPVIAPLREKLQAWRELCGTPASGWIFASENNTPVHLGNLINRNILPVLKKLGIPWRGFHAFRRGLGTNLHSMGVPTEIVRLILRHEDVGTTQRHYILPPAEEVRKAMAQFEERWEREMASAGPAVN